MAVTWAASAPHADAVKFVAELGLGSTGTVSGSVYQSLAWPGNKRAVLTQFTATGTYTTGGDALPLASVGLSEVFAVFPVASSNTNIDQIDTGGGVHVLAGTSKAPVIKLADVGVEETAAAAVTGSTFHAIVVGI